MTIKGAELAELMEQSARDAESFAKQEFKIELDGTENSLQLADEVVSRASKRIKSVEEEKTIFTLSTIVGAYVGEVFRQKHGGEWVYDTSEPTAPAIFLKYNALTFAFTGIAYQRLMHEPSVSLELYYKEACAQVGKHNY